MRVFKGHGGASGTSLGLRAGSGPFRVARSRDYAKTVPGTLPRAPALGRKYAYVRSTNHGTVAVLPRGSCSPASPTPPGVPDALHVLPSRARLARRLVSHRLDTWGHSHTCDANGTLTLITAEPAAYDVRHGHIRAGLRRTADRGGRQPAHRARRGHRTLTSNACRCSAPTSRPGTRSRGGLCSSWRGWRPVGAVAPRVSGPGKTVRAELDTV